MYTQKIALIFDHIKKNNLEVYKPKTFYTFYTSHLRWNSII